MNTQIVAEKDMSKGTVMPMYEWGTYRGLAFLSQSTLTYDFNSLKLAAVSKATLDIICSTAFGYTSDSLHNPHNELAEAYEVLTGSQNGM